MADRLMRLATITIIAFMVWLYAEGATRRSHNVPVTIYFVAPPNTRLLIEPSTTNVSTFVRCATSQLQQVKDLGAAGINIQVTEHPTDPTQLKNIDKALREHDGFDRLGVTIERIDPESIPLRVERLEARSITIELTTPTDLELVGPAIFSDLGQVVLPARSIGDIKGLALQARLDGNALAGVVPGVTTDRVIDVNLPPPLAGVPNLTYTPRKVKVTFTVKKKEDELVVGIVPVLLTIAPNLARQYDVKIDDESLRLRDVKLKGPSDAIARIRSGAQKVEALLLLSAEELEKQVTSKLPDMRVPAGVTVESTLPLVKMTITKRPPPEN